jgi:tRNA(Arg) A34 adenosine deaminase TadA
MYPPHAIIAHAKKEALKAEYRFRLGSIIYDGKWIVGRGHNKPNKTHPQANTPWFTIHSEFDAILRSQRNYTQSALAGLSIFTYRLLNRPGSGNAAPCPHCEVILKMAGINEIYYSGPDETVHKMP